MTLHLNLISAEASTPLNDLDVCASDVPDPPENVKCTSVGEDCGTIVWDAPKFDGGAPIKGKA